LPSPPGPEAEYITADAYVADPVGVQEVAAVRKGQDLERESVHVAVGSQDQAPAFAKHADQRVEDGSRQPVTSGGACLRRQPARFPDQVTKFGLAGYAGAEVRAESVDGLGLTQVDHPRTLWLTLRQNKGQIARRIPAPLSPATSLGQIDHRNPSKFNPHRGTGRAQAGDPRRDLGGQLPRDRDVCHLRGDVFGVGDHLGPDLGQLLPQRRQRPALDRPRAGPGPAA
jgi:hypothetical protein